MDYKNINIKDIQADDNIRKSVHDIPLEELIQSIKERGILQPLIVRAAGKKFDLVAGFRRFQAAGQLKLESVPCVIKDIKDEEKVEIQLIENIQRADLNPIDEAKAIQELAIDHPVGDLVPMLGKTELYIKRQLVLLDLPKIIQKAIFEKKLSKGHGIVLGRLQKDSARLSLFKDIISDRMSISQAESNLDTYASSLEYAPFNKEQCKSCAHAGVNQKDLFDPDSSLKGKCLNPSCFELKLQQYIKERKEYWKEKGITIMSQEAYRQEIGKWRMLSGYLAQEIDKEDIAKEIAEGKTVVITFRDNGTEELLMDEKTYMRLARKKRQVDRTGKSTEEKGSEVDIRAKQKKENRIIETKRRFLLAKLQNAPSKKQLERIALDQLFKTFSGQGFEISDFLKDAGITSKRKENCYLRWDLIKLLEKCKSEAISNAILILAKTKIAGYETETIEKLAGEVNINMSQFRIDEEYLNKFTKDSLLKLIKELDLKPPKKFDSKKKSEMVFWILEKKLSKVPKELIGKK